MRSAYLSQRCLALTLYCRWRHLITPFLPHKDIMEIPWEQLPAVWSEHIAELSHPETQDEEQFAQQYGSGLVKIFNTLSKYEQYRQIELVNSAYTELYKVSSAELGPIITAHGLAFWRVRGPAQNLETARHEALPQQRRAKTAVSEELHPHCPWSALSSDLVQHD